MSIERLIVWLVAFCFLAVVGGFIHNNYLVEGTARACLAKATSPNLAGCMVKR